MLLEQKTSSLIQIDAEHLMMLLSFSCDVETQLDSGSKRWFSGD